MVGHLDDRADEDTPAEMGRRSPGCERVEPLLVAAPGKQQRSVDAKWLFDHRAS
jgi:hypothetical protein